MAIPTFFTSKVKDLPYGCPFQYCFDFYLKGSYDRFRKAYSCIRFRVANDNMSYLDERYFSGDDKVFPAILNLD